MWYCGDLIQVLLPITTEDKLMRQVLVKKKKGLFMSCGLRSPGPPPLPAQAPGSYWYKDMEGRAFFYPIILLVFGTLM